MDEFIDYFIDTVDKEDFSIIDIFFTEDLELEGGVIVTIQFSPELNMKDLNIKIEEYIFNSLSAELITVEILRNVISYFLSIFRKLDIIMENMINLNISLIADKEEEWEKITTS